MWFGTVHVDQCTKNDGHCDLCAAENTRDKGSEFVTFLSIGRADAFVWYGGSGRGRASTQAIFDNVADALYEKIYAYN